MKIFLIINLILIFCFNIETARTTTRKNLRQALNSNKNENDLNLTDKSLREELKLMFQKLELSDAMMFRMISDVNAFVIFNCDKPSYITPDSQLAILKNHIINYDIERRKDPRIKNESSAYVCSKNENIWRVNPEIFKSKGFIGFDHEKAAEADGNFIVLSDEQAIKEYFQNIDSDGELTKKAIDLAFKIIHHPKYYKIDKKKKPKIVDVYAEQDKKIPKWLGDMRNKQINDLYEQFTKETKNFTIPKQSSLKEDTFGDGYSFIIFDCKEPSILHPSNQKNHILTKLNNTLFKIVLKKVGYCDTGENIWFSGKNKNNKTNDDFFLTFDAKGLGLGFSPSIKLLNIMKIKGICDEYMKYMYHPGYYIRDYKKPKQCTSQSSAEKEEQESINKILDSYFDKSNKITKERYEEKKRKNIPNKKKINKNVLYDVNEPININNKKLEKKKNSEKSENSFNGFESE